MDKVVVRTRPRRYGFTLLEVLVALVIFGVITVAVSFTFDTALKTQVANNRRQEELSAVRAVLDYLKRDIEQAYASSNSTAAVFIGSSGGTGPQSSSANGLLTLMTRNNRIVPDASSGQTSGGTTGPGSGPSAAVASNPQSQTVLARYDFDPRAGTLSRTLVGVPNLQTLQQTSPTQDMVIASNIADISLRFYDPTAQSWRTDWDYEQQNQQSTTTQGTGSGTGATTGAASTNTAASTTNNGDTTLPSQVEVTVTIQHPEEGTTATYVSTIPIVTSQVADGQKPPTNTNSGVTTTTTSGATGTGP